MKALLIKAALYIPITFFMVYILLMAISGITCACCNDAQPYCGIFAMIAKILFGAAILVVIGMIVKELYNENKKNHSIQA